MKNAFNFLVFIYSASLELCGMLIVPFLLKLKASKNWNIPDRFALPPLKSKTTFQSVAWVHAASLGESKLLVKFLEILKEKYPAQGFVLTATTRAGVDYLTSISDAAILAVGYFPFDTKRIMDLMVRHFSISRLWLMETELWPSLIWTCMRHAIPIGIVNARMEKKSFTAFKRAAFLCKPIFSYLDVVLAQSLPYAKRFEKLGVRSSVVRVIGNLKNAVDIAKPPLSEKTSLRALMNLSPQDFVITAGCIHEGEGRVLRDTLDILDKAGVSLKSIIVPRYLSESATIAKELGETTLILQQTQTSKPWKTCLIDKLGVLENLYKICDAAFIGGTFVPVGGHNVWDAAQFGVPIFFGPDYHTQQESCEKLLDAGVGFTASSSQDLARLFSTAIKSNADAFTKALSHFIQSAENRRQEIGRLLP